MEGLQELQAQLWHPLHGSRKYRCKATWRSPSAGASGYLWGGLIRRPSGRNNAELTAARFKLLLRASLATAALQSAVTQCRDFFLTLEALSNSLQVYRLIIYILARLQWHCR